MKSLIANSKRRLRHEYRLICSQVYFLLFCAFIMIYLSTMVFRNIAFYRYEARPRLKDLGFDILPDLENNAFWSGLKDVPMSASMWTMGITCACSVVFGTRTTPFAVNMLRRVLAMLSLGHCLRFGTYVVTTIPGTTERCLPGHLDEMHPPQPTTWTEIFFTRIAFYPGNNCGDLMFSGHILGIVTPVLMVHRYGSQCFVDTQLLSAFSFRVLLFVLWTLIAFQSILIVMMRNHYTSDIVVSLYLTPLLWSFYCRVLQPEDVELPQEEGDQEEDDEEAPPPVEMPL